METWVIQDIRFSESPFIANYVRPLEDGKPSIHSAPSTPPMVNIAKEIIETSLEDGAANSTSYSPQRNYLPASTSSITILSNKATEEGLEFDIEIEYYEGDTGIIFNRTV
jgi:hypothetical protein